MAPTQTLVLSDSQQCALSIAPVDAKGQPAQVSGVPTWASSDPTVAAVTASADGLSADVVAGNEGTAQVSATLTVTNPDNTTTTLTGTLAVQVTGGAAVSLAISAAAPTQQGS